MTALTHAQIREVYRCAPLMSVQYQIGLIRLLAMTMRDDPYGNPEVKDYALTALTCADEMDRELAKEHQHDPRDQRRTITVDYTEHRIGAAA